MNNTRVSNSLIGVAGVHYVTSELSRRGLVALPTIRNTPGFDVIVVTPDGTKHANIQVKTSQKRVHFWPMPHSTKVCCKPNDYYVLLRWIGHEKKFEGFMLTGREARKEVKREEDKQRSRSPKRVIMPCVHVRSNTASERWKNRWETFSLRK